MGKEKKIVMPDIAIQKDVGTKNSDGTKLKNLWIELPGYCNLACEYCYAEGGVPENIPGLLTIDDYTNILEQAKMLGVEDIGIPGAGEPFYWQNMDLTMKVLGLCADLGFYTTLFTTGEFITEDLADKLIEMPIELMIKGNSLDPKKQDLFVSNRKAGRMIEGYGQRRNEVLEMLMRKGFNDETRNMEEYGRKSRMALVTSIMTSESNGPSNYDEVEGIYIYCRENNIIVDMDSILKIGRGASCDLFEEDQRHKEIVERIQKVAKEKYGEDLEISSGYLGTVCDRFSYHMYVNQHGGIRPCIGAKDVDLGNAKEIPLEDAWERPEMKIIRARNYKGKCGDECVNFNEIHEARTKEAGSPKYKCNSCLGRRTENLTNELILDLGYIPTIGCWNHRAKE